MIQSSREKMNLKAQDPRDVVVALLNRSICQVQVAAVLVDTYGIYAWAWNDMGPTGLGMHAEARCISRANRKRFPESTLYVAARRRRNHKIITSRPCLSCQPLLGSIGKVVYRDAEGMWVPFST